MNAGRAALEIRLVPKAATEGFLDGHVWAIPLTRTQALALLRLTSGSSLQRRQRNRALQRFLERHIRQHGMPVFGSPSDYRVDFGHVFLRFQLDD